MAPVVLLFVNVANHSGTYRLIALTISGQDYVVQNPRKIGQRNNIELP